MGRTFLRQDTQIRNSSTYGDAVAPSEANYETNPGDLETDLNNIRSQLHNLLKDQAGNWWDDLNVPSTLETGSQRGVNDLNSDLHAVEKKRVLRDVHNLTDVSVGGSDNFVILGAGELPAQTTAAVGAVTTLGTVVAAHGGTFGTHALSEVAGPHALNPLNLCEIVDGATRDPILSDARKVYGLLQGEDGLVDGDTITDSTDNRVQISFVRQNSAGDDLEACPAADIQGKTINYSTRERVRLEDLNEHDFLTGAVVDVGAGSGTINRQTSYSNQGTTPVDATVNAILDLEGAGLEWQIRDDLEAILFRVIEGSAGGTSKVAVEDDVDEFDVDAVVSDFLNGIKVDTGAAGTTINIGVTANQIDTTGALTVQGAGDVKIASTGGNLRLTDQYEPAGWSEDGIQLSDAAQTWTDFEAAFGEVGLMDAILQAYQGANFDKTYASVTSTTVADTDVGGVAGGTNLDAQLHDLSGGTFADDHDVYLNGQLLRSGADAAANHDVYPGTSLPNGQLKFEFTVRVNDVICVISRA